MADPGIGIDLLFERLLATERRVLVIIEGIGSVHVTIPRRVVQSGVNRLLGEADKRFQLTQRELIMFALVAQTESISTADLAKALELPDGSGLRFWLGRLPSWGLVEQSGRTNATRYFVTPALLREAGLDGLTTLTRVQPHRLRALILEDLERFPASPKGDIWRRVGRRSLSEHFALRSRSSSHRAGWSRSAKRRPVTSASSPAFLNQAGSFRTQKAGPWPSGSPSISGHPTKTVKASGTLQAIAERAQVSVSTVQRSLRRSGGGLTEGHKSPRATRRFYVTRPRPRGCPR